MPEKAVKASTALSHAAFAAIAAFLLLLKLRFHEMWKDEWQAWFIATDIPSLADLFAFLPYEGHPSLWFLLLRSAHGLLPDVPDDFVLQLAHFLAGAAALYLFFTRMSLSLWLKLILGFGYFTFFEYFVVNRGYILLVLLCYALSVLSVRPEKNYRYIALLLLLVCQAEVYGVFIAAGFGTYCLFEMYRDRKKCAWILCSALTGLALFVLTVLPSAESGHSAATLHQFSLWDINRYIVAFQSLYCNTFWIGLYPSPKEAGALAQLGISLALAAAIVMLFWQNKSVLAAYAVFALADLLFCAIVYEGGPRQWGLHFIFFTALLPLNGRQMPAGAGRYFVYGMAALTLLFQLRHNSTIVLREMRYPYSNAREAGIFIKKEVPVYAPVLVINKAYAVPVAGYAQRSFFALPEGKEFSYFLWNERMYVPSMEDMLRFREERDYDELFVLSYKPLNLQLYKKLTPVRYFGRFNIREENYYLYRVI